MVAYVADGCDFGPPAFMDAQMLAESGQPSPAPPSEADITGLLLAWRAGDRNAVDRLFPLVYDELRRIAHRQLGRERADHTLGTTALVHEAYLKLVDQTRAQLTDRAHFFAVAARAMRRILVDYARRHRALKRGGAAGRVSLSDAALVASERADTLVALDEALTRLAELDDRLSQVVECRFFGGLTEEETAEALAVTARTVRRDWVKAKGWLYQALRQ
jgi:RNA polymerase sigma factor (TIGR02999 family)